MRALRHYNEALALYERMGAGKSQSADIARGNIARAEEQRRGGRSQGGRSP